MGKVLVGDGEMKIKFQLSELLGIGLTLVVLGIGLAYGLEVMGDVGEDMCDGSNEHYKLGGCYICSNATQNVWNSTNGLCYNGSLGTTRSISPSQTGSTEFNATGNAMEGVAKIPEKMPTIATVVVAAVIIGILITYLWGRFS